MTRTPLSLAVLALAATTGLAQAQAAGSFRALVTNQLDHVPGVSASTDGLSLAQLAQIRAVLEDDDQSTAQKRNRIGVITGRG